MVLAFPLDTLAILQDACNSHSGQAGKPLPARSEWLTRAAGFIPPNAPPFWSMTPAIPPFGVPRHVNLTFWGGVWGLVLNLLFHRLPQQADTSAIRQAKDLLEPRSSGQ
jgi:hypothetical protein